MDAIDGMDVTEGRCRMVGMDGVERRYGMERMDVMHIIESGTDRMERTEGNGRLDGMDGIDKIYWIDRMFRTDRLDRIDGMDWVQCMGLDG